MENPIVFLHLSDIHFSKNSGGRYDLDEDLRHEMEQDVIRIKDRFDNIHGILVTGDIAFSGNVDEYKNAQDWLNNLCEIIKCSDTSIWITPGNHDIDRKITKGFILETLHRGLRSCDPSKVEIEISKIFISPDKACGLLYEPLSNYNSFAAKYRCNINPENQYWEHDFNLNDSSILRIRGLSSTLVSDEFDNDGDNKLVLSTIQLNKMSHKGVTYLTLCHHPPQWLKNQDEIEDKLRTRVSIQLFGHKHRQRLETINGCLRISAGATHPERQDIQWEPRYNFLTISILKKESKRILYVKVYPRVWRSETSRFDRDLCSNGNEFQIFKIPLQDWEPENTIKEKISIESEENETEIAEFKFNDFNTSEIDSKGKLVMNPARTLTYYYLSLPFLKRIEIAQKLQLLNEEDEGIEEEELFRRFFIRAKEKDLLKNLWNEVASNYPDKMSKNPYDMN